MFLSLILIGRLIKEFLLFAETYENSKMQFDYNREQIRTFEEVSCTVSHSREYRV